MNSIDILIVDDNPSDAELTIRAIKKSIANVQIFHVKDGAEAIEFLLSSGSYSNRATSTKPKVIFLDLKMPMMNGFDTLKVIRANELISTIPVVIYSSSNQPEDLTLSQKLGVNSYVVKPIESEKFSLIAAAMGNYWLNIHQQ